MAVAVVEVAVLMATLVVADYLLEVMAQLQVLQEAAVEAADIWLLEAMLVEQLEVRVVQAAVVAAAAEYKMALWAVQADQAAEDVVLFTIKKNKK